MRDLWYPGLSVTGVAEAPTAGGTHHHGPRSKPSLPLLVKHHIRDGAGSSRGREFQNLAALKTHHDVHTDSKLLNLHQLPASVTAREAAPQAAATSLPEVSVVRLLQESARAGGCNRVSEGIPVNDCSSSVGRTDSAGRLRFDLVVREGPLPIGHSTSGAIEQGAAGKEATPQSFQRTKQRKEKLGEACNNMGLRGGDRTTGVQASSSMPCTTNSVRTDDWNCDHVHTSASSCCAHWGEGTDCTNSSKTVDECGTVLMSQMEQNCNLGYGGQDSGVGTRKVSTESQLLATRPAIERLLSIANSNTTRGSDCAPLAPFCGWLPYEPTLQRDAIFASRKEDPTSKRSVKSSIRQKGNTMAVFRHLDTADEYMVEYLEHHSFTYSTVRVRRPPPKSCCVRYTENCNERCKMPVSQDNQEVGSAVSVTSPPKATRKNWICLTKLSAPSTGQIGSDLTLECTFTSRSNDNGAEEEGEGDCSCNEPTADRNGEGLYGPPAVSRKAPLDMVTEEVGHTSSNISVNKYLIVHSQKNQAKETVGPPEVEEDDVAVPGSQEFDPCGSSIPVCDSGPSLTSDSHTSLAKGKDVQNMYKFPQFQTVSAGDKSKQKEDSQSYSSKQTIIGKARSLGLVSHCVLHEKRLKDLLDQCVWQERSRSCHYGRRTASREKSKKSSGSSNEPKKAPSQRGFSAAVRVYTAQMGARWNVPSRQKSCRSHSKQHSSRQEDSATKSGPTSTSPTSCPSGSRCSATTHTTPSPAPPSIMKNVSATRIFLQRRTAAVSRSRGLPVVPEAPPQAERKEERGMHIHETRVKQLISTVPQPTPHRMY